MFRLQNYTTNIHTYSYQFVISTRSTYPFEMKMHSVQIRRSAHKHADLDAVETKH